MWFLEPVVPANAYKSLQVEENIGLMLPCQCYCIRKGRENGSFRHQTHYRHADDRKNAELRQVAENVEVIEASLRHCELMQIKGEFSWKRSFHLGCLSLCYFPVGRISLPALWVVQVAAGGTWWVMVMGSENVYVDHLHCFIECDLFPNAGDKGWGRAGEHIWIILKKRFIAREKITKEEFDKNEEGYFRIKWTLTSF